MNIALPDSVVEIVRQKFLPKEQSEAIELLSEYQCNDLNLRERVLYCVVSLAGRDFDRLKHFLECASEDYRNLIYWHEHAEQSREKFFRNQD